MAGRVVALHRGVPRKSILCRAVWRLGIKEIFARQRAKLLLREPRKLTAF